MRKLRVLFRGGSNIASLLVVGSNAFLIGMFAFLEAKAGTFSLWTMVVLPLLLATALQLWGIIHSRISDAVFHSWLTRRQTSTENSAEGVPELLSGWRRINHLAGTSKYLIIATPRRLSFCHRGNTIISRSAAILVVLPGPS